MNIIPLRPIRLCRNLIAREGNDRSNLISSRIHEITTTPERRLVMTKKNCDRVSGGGQNMVAELVLEWSLSLSKRAFPFLYPLPAIGALHMRDKLSAGGGK